MPYVRQRTWLAMAPRSLSREVVFGPRGMGQVPQGPVSPDVTSYYQAGLVFGAGGTPSIDLSQGFPSAEAQQAFVSGANAAQAPVTLAQTTGAAGPIVGAVVPTAVATGAPGVSTFLQQNQNLLVWGGLGLIGLIALMRAFK